MTKNTHKFPYKWTLKDTNFTKDKGKVFSCFACCGGSSMGYKLAGFDVIGCNEIDSKMMDNYIANHHPKYSFNCDIRDLKTMELPEELYNLDIFDASPPCFVKGTKVLTKDGYKNIEDIKSTDFVLTHKGNYKPVYQTMSHIDDNMFEMKVQGSIPIKVTGNHPFYVKTITNSYETKKRSFSKANWKNVQELDIKKDYVGIKINTNSSLPIWRIFNVDTSTFQFWKFIGKLLSNGFVIDSTKVVVICCNEDEQKEIKRILSNFGFIYTVQKEKEKIKFNIINAGLYHFVKHFISSEETKIIPNFVYDLPITHLSSFLEGYVGSDEYFNKKSNNLNISNASLELILGFQQIVTKLFKNQSFISVLDDNCTYSLSFFKENNEQCDFIEEDGYIWIPIEYIKKIDEKRTVYNISVEDDESYTVNNISCHNCTSFSMSGNREKDWGKEKVFREGQVSQVLDTLFFDTIDVVNRLQPKIVICENVKGIILGKAKEYVKRIYEEFDKAGYYCQHFLLNASKMGVPQRRERVFFLCLRKDLCQGIPKIDMTFDEEPIKYGEFVDPTNAKPFTPWTKEVWNARKPEDRSLARAFNELTGKKGWFSCILAKKDEVLGTLTAHRESGMCYDEPRFLSTNELFAASTFPSDFKFIKGQPYYFVGMSVPPVMMAQVATRVYDIWIAKKPEPIDDIETFEKKKILATEVTKEKVESGEIKIPKNKPIYIEGTLFPEMYEK